MKLKRIATLLLLLSAAMYGRAAGEIYLMDYAVQMELQETEAPECLKGKEYLSLCTHDASQNAAVEGYDGMRINTLSSGLVNKTTFSIKTDSEKYGSYTPLRELSWMPVPIMVAGFIAKGQKKNFREARQNLQPDFHHRFDDQLQFGGIALATGLKIAGVEGRSTWGRYLASTGFSYATMALIVNVVKNSAHEMRPDGSTANSFPSGHTATAFVGATILHKEYGLTRSPWYSVAGYAMATTTGVMRSLNNRHWISDILVGAGVGILSTDLGYMLGDVIFKKKGIVREEREGLNDLRKNPSFFSISMGAGFSNDVPFDMTTLSDNLQPTEELAVERAHLRIGTATNVQAELGYFPFKSFPYIGVGARFRVSTAPVRANDMKVYEDDGTVLNNPQVDITDQMAIFSEDFGLYFHYPLSRRFAVGAKVLAGSQQHSDVRLYAKAWDEGIRAKYLAENPTCTAEELDDNSYTNGDQIRIMKDTNFKWGAGISLTYAYRNGIAWKVYADYDSANTDFNGMYYSDRAYNRGTMTAEDYEIYLDGQFESRTRSFSFKKIMNTLSVGASMSIMF